MSRVAIVVQRCHESIAGGSEALAWQYAVLLREQYETEVLTTTALDYAQWENVLPEGLERRDGINIRRFKVTTGRSPHWPKLYDRLLQDYRKGDVGRRRLFEATRYLPWSIGLQEEFIKHQGPYSAGLMRFLAEKCADYKTIIFITYLYPTSYFGLLQVPRRRALFAPTLHDEPTAYLSAYKHAARRARALIWLTRAEQRLGHDLWGDLPGYVVASEIEARPRTPVAADKPYLLYCGRIDPNKGTAELFDYFTEFKKHDATGVRLVLTGKDSVPVPAHADIDFRGFVSDEEKFTLMAGATAFVMPSKNESFSIVTLEAMAQGTPVLASSGSEVLVDHIIQSGAGAIYNDYASFAAALNRLLSSESTRREMGALGREYVTSRYALERIRSLLIEAVESCAATPGANQAQAKPELTTASQTPPLPLPLGYSEQRLRDFITSVQVEDGPPEELKTYANGDFKRFIYTLALVPDEPRMTVLELGANPYFTTTLLYKFRCADLHLANFFDRAEREGVQKVTIHQTGEVIAYRYKQFNVEKEAFPYEDEFFDVVLFCEIIEHLLTDPVQALLEIRRVLKPGGSLVLTTPNVARLENVAKIIDGENVYDPYSGYGPYGRHNREYTKQELLQLLSENGFHIETSFTADVHNNYTARHVPQEKISALTAFRKADLGQYLFTRSSVSRDSKQLPPVRPEWLYRSFHNKAQT